MIRKQALFGLLATSLVLFSVACQEKNTEEKAVLDAAVIAEETVGADLMPAWAVNANIYEVNIRQYTPEGTFNAFAEHLDRLNNMGVKMLWLMPIYPISTTKKKGSLGSYYAVSDYTAVNPEFGTAEDFKNLVDKIHTLDMKVILDWVPNHTGWDHVWIEDHPEYFTHVADTITHPFMNGEPTDWYDVAELDFDNMDMREEMTQALEYWITEYDVDGYRCDVAFEVPDDYWDSAVSRMRAIKPVFMLAEAEHPPHRNSGNFHMSYPWSFMHLTNEIGKGVEDVNAIDKYLLENAEKFNKGFQMSFTTNHDENSWNGTEFERYGDAHQTFAVLTGTLTGMPLIYSGQEEPLEKRLAFFDKDDIEFGDFKYESFYKTLLTVHRDNKALWNGIYGGQPVRLNESETVYAFKREKDGDKVVVVLNFSDSEQTADLTESVDGMREIFTQEAGAGQQIDLAPYGYKVFEQKASM